MPRRLVFTALLLRSLGLCQPPPPPPPEPKPVPEAQPARPESGDKDKHHRFGPPGSTGGGPSRDMRDGGSSGGPFGRPGSRNDAWEKLSDDDKRSIRRAFEAAWDVPAVAAARDRAMHANNEMREALMVAIKDIDPHAFELSQKLRTEMPSFQMGMMKPPLPRPEDPDFPQSAINRLRQEMMGFVKPEQRETAGKLHDKVMLAPEVVAAIEAIRKAEPSARMEAFKKLHETYKQAMERAVGEMRKKQAEKSADKPEDKPKE